MVSPVRWNVLFVEPCEDGHAPVASDAQPTPVFGGKRLEQAVPALEAVVHEVVHLGQQALRRVPVDEIGPHAVGREQHDLVREIEVRLRSCASAACRSAADDGEDEQCKDRDERGYQQKPACHRFSPPCSD